MELHPAPRTARPLPPAAPHRPARQRRERPPGTAPSAPFDRPSPDLAYLAHPAITGITPEHFTAITTHLLLLLEARRAATLTQQDKQPGHRPRPAAKTPGHRRGVLTLADRLLAEILHQRHALPQTQIAALFGVGRKIINRHIHHTRALLACLGITIEPADTPLKNLNTLYHHAATAGISIPTLKIKTAC